MVTAGEVVNNFYVIEIADRIRDEIIFKVQCVCGSVGNISSVGLDTRISCGCTNLVGEHKIGLKTNCYRFIRFAGDGTNAGYRNKCHMFEIECDRCSNRSIVHARYKRKYCPLCKRPPRARPVTVLSTGLKCVFYKEDADKVGIFPSALRQRIQRLGMDKAMSFHKRKVGGCRNKYGKVWFNNNLEYISVHLESIEKLNRMAAVYDWIRKGVDPSMAVEMTLYSKENVNEVLRNLRMISKRNSVVVE